MLPISGMAVFSQDAIGENLRGFLSSYAATRVVIIFLWLRAGVHEKRFRPTAVRYVTGFTLSLFIVWAAIALGSRWSLVLFPAALFIDVLTPIFTINQQKALPRLTRSKLPERFGLVAIILLGEMVVGIIRGLNQPRDLSRTNRMSANDDRRILVSRASPPVFDSPAL